MKKIRFPWFRVHIVILNDPGRLISVHLMHTGLVAAWSSVMVFYELITLDPTDPVYNPIWRQGCYGIPFLCRLGVIRSLYPWSLGIKLSINLSWTYETMNMAHIFLSGFSIFAAIWHWAYWDFNLFFSSPAQDPCKLVLDLNQILGIHLHLASLLCFGFGLAHVSGFQGPGIWTSDSFGVVGSMRFVKPIYSVIGLAPFCYGVLSSHHIAAGFFAFSITLWHISSRPRLFFYKLFKMANIEEVLSRSIAAVFFTAFLSSALMWYAWLSTALELFGPSRYQWDNGYFCVELEARVKSVKTIFFKKAWEEVPDKLVLYDYIGCNPSKGGLFRSGPILKGDGILQNWLGHPSFEIGTLSLAIRRMPAFFETFPVILIDQRGSLRADIAFRRAESRYSMEQTHVLVSFSGGILNATEYSTPSLVKDYARKAQFGQIFTFEKKTAAADGVFRTSPRGWYSFSHTAFAFFFFFGHLWHASRGFSQDIWSGLSVTLESLYQTEYGRNEKLGDKTTKTSTFL
jgi:photosystem II CP47 chlorophyll apoprotein